MSFGFLVINVCNHGEHYDTPCTYGLNLLILMSEIVDVDDDDDNN